MISHESNKTVLPVNTIRSLFYIMFMVINDPGIVNNAIGDWSHVKIALMHLWHDQCIMASVS